MLYEKYKKRVKRYASILQTIKKYRILISVILGIIIASTSTALGVKGIVYTSAECPERISYGEELSYEAKAILGKADYEYSTTADFKEILDTAPKLPGTYYLRAVSTSSFGNPRYGDVQVFTIYPREVEVLINSTVLTYGTAPEISADMRYGDKIVCTEFIYDDISKETTPVAARLEAIKVTDITGADVTHAYKFITPKKDITFGKLNITLTVESETKIYNGSELFLEKWTVSSGAFAALNGGKPDEISAIFDPSLKDVGSVSSTINKYKVLSPDGIDVTERYNITIISGTLTVDKRPVIIELVSGENAEFVYDGKDHTSTDFAVSESTPLPDGHRIEISSSTVIKNVGTTENLLTFKFYDKKGNDVTDNYSATLNGNYTISILKRDVTFETASDEWTYDGSSHTNSTYTVKDGSVVKGESANVIKETTILYAGTKENELSLQIIDEDGNDVSENYNISYVNGTITVNKRPISITTSSETWVYDGLVHSLPEFTYDSKSLLPVKGHITEITSYSSIKNVFETTTGKIDNVLNIKIYNEGGMDLSSNYDISYTYGALKLEKRAVKIHTSSAEKVYDATPFYFHRFSYAENSYDFLSGEILKFVEYASRTNAGESENIFSIEVYGEDGTDLSANYSITYESYGTIKVSPRDVTVITASNTAGLIYNGEFQSDTGWVVKDGSLPIIDGHTATVVPGTSIKDVAEPVKNIFTLTITDEDENNLDENYNFIYELGDIKINPRPVKVTTASFKNIYDGEYHSINTWKYTEGTSYTILDGETYTTSAPIAIRDVMDGEKSNIFVISVFRGTEDISHNYNFIYTYGKIAITKRPITIKTESGSWMYDGYTHSVLDWSDISSSPYGIIPGEVGTVAAYATITDFVEGGIKNDITLQILRNNADISENYDITYETGNLTITKRPVSILTNNGSWTYDASAKSNTGWTYKNSPNQFVASDSITPVNITYVTNVFDTPNGVCENKFGVEVYGIRNGKNTKITDNYEITYAYGNLKINPRPVSIVTGTTSIIYDGTFRDYQNFIYSSGSQKFVAGQKFKYLDTAKIKNIGSTTNTYTLEVWSSDGLTDYTSNYTITYASYGTITITKRDVYIKTATNLDSLIYNGEYQYDATWSHQAGSLEVVASHTTVSKNYPTIRDVDKTDKTKSLKNEFELIIKDEDEKDVTYNYNIHYEYGYIRINPRPVNVTTDSIYEVYDGTWHSTNGWTYLSENGYKIVDGETYTTTTAPKIRDVWEGPIQNIYTIHIQRGSENIDHNYEISYNYGTISLYKRSIYLISHNGEWIYDGIYHYNTDWSYTDESPYEIVVGEVYKINSYTKICDYIDGGVKNNISIDIWRLRNESDRYIISTLDNSQMSAYCDNMAGNYIVNYSFGKLKINKRPISVTSASGKWDYDGNYHYIDGTTGISPWIYTPGNTYEIVAGEAWELASYTKAIDYTDGGTENAIKISILRSGRNIDYNYDFTYINGILTIDKIPISVSTGSATWQYDANEHSKPIWEYLPSSKKVLSDEIIRIENLTKVTNVFDTPNGERENKFNLRIFDMRDGEQVNVNINYDISYNYGNLEITKLPIHINTPSGEWIYDGEPHTLKGFTYSTGSLKVIEGQRIGYEDCAEIKDVGQIDNTFNLYITDASGAVNLSENYNVIFDSLGKLKVKARPVYFTTGSNSWEYDGKAHAHPSSTLDKSSPYELVSGHNTKAIISSSVTYVTEGKVDNVLTLMISDANGVNVTSNYDITFTSYGKIEIIPRKITITTATNCWEYDELQHQDTSYTVTSEKGLVVGDVLTVLDSAFAGPKPGEYENIFHTISIYNGTRDAKPNYEVSYENGTLTILASTLTILAESAEKEYDGTPLTAPDYKILSGEIFPGHKIRNIEIEGSIIDVGTEPNKIVQGSVRIFDGETDVTDLYKIIYVDGKLEITDPDQEEDKGGNLNANGGLGGDAGKNNAEDKDIVVLKINGTNKGSVYLRLMSFGDYYGKGFGNAPEYGLLLNEKYSANYLTSFALSYAGYIPHNLSIDSYTSDYLLPTYFQVGQGYTNQTSDVAYSGTIHPQYSSLYFNAFGISKVLEALEGYEFADEELAYREFVRQNYLAIDAETLNYMNKIIEAQGFDASDDEIIYKVESYISNSAKYNLKYNAALDEEENAVIAFLETYKEGVCRHYAASATMLYRALGIPARYTIGYRGDISKENTWTDVTADNAHAWVEIYVNGIGWVMRDPTYGGGGDGDSEWHPSGPGSEGGSGGGAQAGGNSKPEDPLPKDVTIKPVDVIKEYDGTPLYAQNRIDIPEDSAIEYLVNKGFTYTLTVSGERTAIGKGESAITSFTIFDPNGKDMTSEFNLTFEPGEIYVTQEQVIIHLYELTKFYDGTPLSYAPDDYYITKIPAGHTLQFELSGSLTNAGEFDKMQLLDLPYKILDQNGADVTDNFYLNIEGDGMKIFQSNILLTAASETKIYDGVPLSNSDYKITLGSLVEGHTLSVKVEGSITNVGTTENRISKTTVTDADGNDVTKNYLIQTKTGVLEILPE